MRRFIPSLKAGIAGFMLIAMCVVGLISLTQNNAPRRSSLDNRMLTQFELPTVTTFLDGSWMKSTENFVDDRLIRRTNLLSLHSVIAGKVLHSSEIAGVWAEPKTNMMFDKMPVLADPKHLEPALADLQQATDKAEIPLIFAYVPRKQEVFADELPRHWTNPYVASKPELLDILKQYGDVVDLTSAVGSKENRMANWYLTDHHWNGNGAIAASNAVREKLAALGLPAPQPLPELDEVTRYKPFIGSIGKKLTASGVPEVDDFEIAWAKNAELTHCINKPVQTKTCKSPIFYEKFGNANNTYSNRYATFLSGDNAIDDLRGSGTGTYIVLKDSFGDSFVPYLALGAKRIVSIDERHYTRGDLTTLIRDIKPDGVIWLHNQLSLSLLTPEQLAVWK